ncbi:hypothetical protein ACOMHN_020804 [Nucella lapillus]
MELKSLSHTHPQLLVDALTTLGLLRCYGLEQILQNKVSVLVVPRLSCLAEIFVLDFLFTGKKGYVCNTLHCVVDLGTRAHEHLKLKDRSQPQRIASPDWSQPQRIASPDRSQPQGITPPDRSQPQGVTSLDRSQLQGITNPQQIHPRRITLPGRVQSPRTACPDRSQTHGVARPKRLQPKISTRLDWSQSTGITPLDKNGPLKKTHPDRNQSRQIVPSVWWQSQGTSPKLCQFLSQLPEIAQPHSGNSKQRTPSDHGQCHRNTSGDQRQPRRKAPANQGCCRENLTSFHGERQQSTSPCSLPSACMRSKNCTFLITDPSTQRTQTTQSQMHTPLAADCAVELVGQDSAPGDNMQCDSDDSIKHALTAFGKKLFAKRFVLTLNAL